MDLISRHVLVLCGATGDLARRKLLPGLFLLAQAGFLSDWRLPFERPWRD